MENKERSKGQNKEKITDESLGSFRGRNLQHLTFKLVQVAQIIVTKSMYPTNGLNPYGAIYMYICTRATASLSDIIYIYNIYMHTEPLTFVSSQREDPLSCRRYLCSKQSSWTLVGISRPRPCHSHRKRAINSHICAILYAVCSCIYKAICRPPTRSSVHPRNQLLIRIASRWYCVDEVVASMQDIPGPVDENGWSDDEFDG